jgi:hypothetical protein
MFQTPRPYLLLPLPFKNKLFPTKSFLREKHLHSGSSPPLKTTTTPIKNQTQATCPFNSIFSKRSKWGRKNAAGSVYKNLNPEVFQPK